MATGTPDPEELFYTVALTRVEGVGPVIAKNLIAYCGGAKAVFQKPKGFLIKVPEVGPRLADSLLKATLALKRAETEMSFCARENVQVLTFLSAEYPEALKTIHDAPLLLYKKGSLDLNAQPAVSIVGTRKVTPYGKKWAEKFATCFAQAGLNVVSGLAYGVDIHAHRAVLQQGGITTGVVAHGLDTLYPAVHKKYAQQMLERGALVSEHVTGTEAKAVHFPARNRIIAGMCKATVVIEAANKGGALITAYQAFEQNREVYAVPGALEAEYSEGCNQLIRESVAKLVTHPEEVLVDLGLLTPEAKAAGSLERVGRSLGPNTQRLTSAHRAYKPVDVPLTAEEQQVLNLLSHKPLGTDDIAFQCQMNIATLMPVLFTLEFKGFVEQQPGRQFVRL